MHVSVADNECVLEKGWEMGERDAHARVRLRVSSFCESIVLV